VAGEERREGRRSESGTEAASAARKTRDGGRPVRAGPGGGRAAEERRGRDKPLHGSTREDLICFGVGPGSGERKAGPSC
jgi:hypothetical protein